MQETGESRRTPALDGVRGLAILLVLVGHGGVPYHLGALGAAGVTLFFALSGYLITGILVAERDRSGRVNLRRFYARRMTRLAPPLFVMLAVVCAVSWPGWGVLLPAATWTTNYAPVPAGLSPFGHTWSLGVEEQFYLLWPLALAFLPRGRAARVVAWVVVALMAWRLLLLAGGHFNYAYTALETSGSAILAGAVVALAKWRLRAMWAPVCLAGMICCSLLAGSAGGVAWLWVPLVTTPMAAGLVAAAPSCRWLTWRPLTFAGITSYSVYLWHIPVTAMLVGAETPVGVAAGAAVGLVAYRLVEAPLMTWRQAGRTGVQTFRLRNEAVHP